MQLSRPLAKITAGAYPKALIVPALTGDIGCNVLPGKDNAFSF